LWSQSPQQLAAFCACNNAQLHYTTLFAAKNQPKTVLFLRNNGLYGLFQPVPHRAAVLSHRDKGQNRTKNDLQNV
jgi:hypothetical protein